MEIGQDAVERVADSADLVGMTERRACGNEPDPALAGLGGALFAATVDSSGLSALLIDQLSVAIGIYVTQRYGECATRGVFLCQDQGMRSRLDDEFAIGELALTCNVSQAVFLCAFRETTGTTPYQFFMQERVKKARGCSSPRRYQSPRLHRRVALPTKATSRGLACGRHHAGMPAAPSALSAIAVM